mgnify:CR=1 FL=1
MKYLINTILAAILFVVPSVFAQTEEKPRKAENVSMVFPAVGFQLPAGDLADRFGFNSTIGLGYQHKTKGNWLYMTDLNFIFGNEINQDSLIQNLINVDGFVISDNGQVANVSFFERGFYTTFRVGKIIPLSSGNPNSGLMLMAGGGFVQHRIHIKVEQDMAAALRGDYRKGYDRLSSGFSAAQFIGYMHMGKNRLHSFFAGFEIVEGWTQNRRSMNFDTMRRDDEIRFDMLYGIKAGWIIPFRKRMAKDYYYY